MKAINHFIQSKFMLIFLHKPFSTASPAGIRLLATFFFGCGVLLLSCRSVKPYQRIYLNEEAMQMGKRPLEKISSNAHNYREGASGGGRAKSSGGCGCN